MQSSLVLHVDRPPNLADSPASIGAKNATDAILRPAADQHQIAIISCTLSNVSRSFLPSFAASPLVRLSHAMAQAALLGLLLARFLCMAPGFCISHVPTCARTAAAAKGLRDEKLIEDAGESMPCEPCTDAMPFLRKPSSQQPTLMPDDQAKVQSRCRPCSPPLHQHCILLTERYNYPAAPLGGSHVRGRDGISQTANERAHRRPSRTYCTDPGSCHWPRPRVEGSIACRPFQPRPLAHRRMGGCPARPIGPS